MPYPLHDRASKQLPKRWQQSRDPLAARASFIRKFSCRGPVYENCRIYAGDGRLLCFCDRKKLDWYVGRGLAEYVTADTIGSITESPFNTTNALPAPTLSKEGEGEEGGGGGGGGGGGRSEDDGKREREGCSSAASSGSLQPSSDSHDGHQAGSTAPLLAYPPSIRLLFEPKGRPEDDDNEFYIQSKRNCCVGCGEAGHYLRYRVVPSCYRHAFPERLKSHRSHDIVLLCVDCHEAAHAAAERHKRVVAERFGVPLQPPPVALPIQSHPGGATEDRSGEGESKHALAGDDGSSDSAGVTGHGSGSAHIDVATVRRAIVAVLRHGASLPPHRLRELLHPIRLVLGRTDGSRPLTVAEVEAAAGLVGHPTRSRVPGRRQRQLSAADRVRLDAALAGEVAGRRSGEGGREGEEGTGDALVAFEERETSGEGINVESKGAVGDSEGAVPAGRSGCAGACRGSATRIRMQRSGHWEHGERVVAMLRAREAIDVHAAEDGEEESASDAAVRDFIQEWREVFVTALNPQFLPPGWDVRHSGRREFGEYSVYGKY